MHAKLIGQPFIIPFICSFASSDFYYIVSELATADLFDVIHTQQLTEDDAKFFASHIFLGMNAMHEVRKCQKRFTKKIIFIFSDENLASRSEARKFAY
jgi:serine/threonine protein kinase